MTTAPDSPPDSRDALSAKVRLGGLRTLIRGESGEASHAMILARKPEGSEASVHSCPSGPEACSTVHQIRTLGRIGLALPECLARVEGTPPKREAQHASFGLIGTHRSNAPHPIGTASPRRETARNSIDVSPSSDGNARKSGSKSPQCPAESASSASGASFIDGRRSGLARLHCHQGRLDRFHQGLGPEAHLSKHHDALGSPRVQQQIHRKQDRRGTGGLWPPFPWNVSGPRVRCPCT
jgi:hypothetical protein